MLGEKRLKNIAKQALSYSKADQTRLHRAAGIASGDARQGSGGQAEVIIWAYDRGLTRFANSQIHQNVANEEAAIQVRAIRGKRIGVASANSLDPKTVKKVVEKANEIARLQKEDPYFVSLPTPKKHQKVKAFFPKTAAFSHNKKAKAVSEVIKIAKSENLVASGAFDTALSEVAIANSLGVWTYHVGTSANLSTVFLGETPASAKASAGGATGFASFTSKDVSDIDHISVAKTAAEKAKKGRKPKEIEPGDYEVILEPPAVWEMLKFFSWLGPNARIYHEEASFLTGKLGQKVFSKNITLWDDSLHPKGFVQPFDLEGHPKKKIPIIEKGILKNIAYDSYHAQKHGVKNTGHALPAPNTWGPMPTHLVLEPGDLSLEEMIEKVKRGLLVTRFWYLTILNHKLLNISGMTRDGTFLIENGKVVSGVKNMRFTQSIPESLNNVVAIGKDLKLEGSFLVPALHLGKWHFSSKTEF